jgi:thioredoxin
MAIQVCEKCGSKNRVNERAAAEGKQPLCGKCGAQLKSDGGGAAYDTGRPKIVTDQTFAREVVEASARMPVLLDCWAPWCGPCRMVAPVLDQLASESQGRYLIAKLNVDENPRTSAQFSIQSIPTLFIFKGGQVVERLVGAQPKQVIAARLAAHL